MPPPAPAGNADPRGPLRRATDALARTAMRAGFPLLKLWWRLSHPTIEGVYVAVWHAGRVLLIRNSYRNVYSFPSGRRGRNEPPEAAALRELREEVGVVAPPGRLVHVMELRLETRLVTDHVHVFELELEAEPMIAIDHREVVWAAFEPPDEACRRPLLPVPARYLAGPRGE